MNRIKLGVLTIKLYLLAVEKCILPTLALASPPNTHTVRCPELPVCRPHRHVELGPEMLMFNLLSVLVSWCPRR